MKIVLGLSESCFNHLPELTRGSIIIIMFIILSQNLRHRLSAEGPTSIITCEPTGDSRQQLILQMRRFTDAYSLIGGATVYSVTPELFNWRSSVLDQLETTFIGYRRGADYNLLLLKIHEKNFKASLHYIRCWRNAF